MLFRSKKSYSNSSGKNSIRSYFGRSFRISCLAISFLMLFILSSTTTISFAASTPSFSTPINLGAGVSGAAQNPNIAASGSCVYVSYPHATSGHGMQMYVRSSSNNGVTLNAAVDVSQNMAGKHNFQRIWATGSTTAYITWEQTLSGGAQNILFSATINCGASWSTPQVLNTVVIPSTCPYLCAQPTLIAIGSDVYVTWTQQNPFQTAMSPSCAPTKGAQYCEDVYVRASTDGGSTWGAEHFFGNSGYIRGGHEPEIAASGSNVYITFDDSRAYFSRSTDNGATWQSYTTVSTSENALIINQEPTASGVLNREPHIAADGNNVYLVWESSYLTSTTHGKESTWLQVSTDDGSTWPLGLNNPISFGLNGGTWLPIVFPSGSYVYVSWGQIIKGTFEAEFAHSSTGGTSQSSWAQNLNSPFNSLASSGAHDTQLAASGALVYVMYFAGSGTQPTVVESTDGGTTFGSPVVISQGTGATTEVQNDQPQIVISGSKVCATWLQSVGGTQEALYSFASSP